jgi:cation diffusion facilitator family transporter
VRCHSAGAVDVGRRLATRQTCRMPGSASASGGTRGTVRSVLVTLAVVVTQSVLLGVLTALTGSSTLYAETMFSVADVGVELFLLVGLLRAARPPDAAHPLGYGREAYFWSLLASLGLLLGGGLASILHGIGALRHSEPAGDYLFSYLLVAAITAMDGYALLVSWRGLRAQAVRAGRAPLRQLLVTTDPAEQTVLAANALAVASGPIAVAGLAAHQATGNAGYDAAAGIVIGVLLAGTALLLVRTNQTLIASPSLDPEAVEGLRAQVAAFPGVTAVPQLTAVITGPHQVLVALRASFDETLTRQQVASAMAGVERALRDEGIAAVYVSPYLADDHDGEAAR